MKNGDSGERPVVAPMSHALAEVREARTRFASGEANVSIARARRLVLHRCRAWLMARLIEEEPLTKIHHALEGEGLEISYSTLYRYAIRHCGFGRYYLARRVETELPRVRDRRRHHRWPADGDALVEFIGAPPLVSRLIDTGAGGACLVVRGRPVIGQRCLVALHRPDEDVRRGPCFVRWIRSVRAESRVGVQWEDPEGDV